MHPIARARERYGIELTPADLVAIEGQITGRSSVLVRRNSDSGGEWHMVLHAGRVLIAVARECDDGKHVVTFLPEHAMRAGASGEHYGRRAGHPVPRKYRRHRHF